MPGEKKIKGYSFFKIAWAKEIFSTRSVSGKGRMEKQ
jgi:hypothetical protein